MPVQDLTHHLYVSVFSSKAPLYDMQGHEDKILAIDWSVPQYMLSGGADNSLKIFKYVDKSSEAIQWMKLCYLDKNWNAFRL